MSAQLGNEVQDLEVVNGGAGDKPGLKNEFRLHDIERQLDRAESRCNTLKDQLDTMKGACAAGRGRVRKVSVLKAPHGVAGSTVALEDSSTNTEAAPNRQQSNHIETDHTGAAVRTINNILNGITNSVNRLTEIATPRVLTAGAEAESLVPELKIERARGLKRKIRSGRASSQLAVKKPSRVEKRGRSVAVEKKPSHLKNLVVVYHNEALKQSDSDESNLKKSRQKEDIPLGDIEDPPRTLSLYSKNYELPTVASRMKQVAKSYLGSLNLKTIPFCAAISTTQSHNIGINIQQVMNIIKNRQPINGISPTLAHNIGLAAEKFQNKPFSALVSSINSRISQTSRCPLSRTFLNMQQLQEQAKMADTIEEGDEEAGDSPETQTVIITGPSGDMEVKTRNLPNWREDQNTEKCTCVGLQQMTNRYQRNIRTITENSLNTQKLHNLKKYAQPIRKGETLKGREKTLKEVLASLHHDFDALNRRYEDLTQKSGEENVEELEKLEVELTKKEEEITMVMTLYKEVMALKQQIKQLKEKRSQSSLASKEVQETRSKFKEYKNPEAAFHLTKLLKQIQHYQMRYKTNLCQE